MCALTLRDGSLRWGIPRAFSFEISAHEADWVVGAIVRRPDNFVDVGMREIHSAPEQPVNVGMRGFPPPASSQAPRDGSCMKTIAVGAAGDREFEASSSATDSDA